MPSYQGQVLADGASAYWRLDEASGLSAVDLAGGHTGTISGGVTLGQASGFSDGSTAALFNGSTGQVALPSLNPGSLFTLEGWVKFSSAPVTDQCVLQVGSAGVYVMGSVSGKLEVVAGGLVLTVGTAASQITDTAWHHVAVSYDGATAKLYLDSVDVSGTTAVHAAGAAVGFIGKGAFGNFANGVIKDAAWYPSVLTQAQIKLHVALAHQYASIVGGELDKARILRDAPVNDWPLSEATGSVATDLGSGANNGTYDTHVTLGLAGPLADGSTAAGFSGTTTGGKVTVAPGALGTTCTIECWVFVGGGGLDGTDTILANSTGAIGLYHLSQGVSAGHLSLFFTTDHLNTTVLTVSQWYHVLITIAAGSGTFYLNGVADGTFTGWPGATFNAIGQNNSVNEVFNGRLYGVRLYTTALTARHAAEHYGMRLAVASGLRIGGATGVRKRATLVGSGGCRVGGAAVVTRRARVGGPGGVRVGGAAWPLGITAAPQADVVVRVGPDDTNASIAADDGVIR